MELKLVEPNGFYFRVENDDNTKMVTLRKRVRFAIFGAFIIRFYVVKKNQRQKELIFLLSNVDENNLDCIMRSIKNILYKYACTATYTRCRMCVRSIKYACTYIELVSSRAAKRNSLNLVCMYIYVSGYSGPSIGFTQSF